jgi:hypothetical protein
MVWWHPHGTREKGNTHALTHHFRRLTEHLQVLLLQRFGSAVLQPVIDGIAYSTVQYEASFRVADVGQDMCTEYFVCTPYHQVNHPTMQQPLPRCDISRFLVLFGPSNALCNHAFLVWSSEGPRVGNDVTGFTSPLR